MKEKHSKYNSKVQNNSIIFNEIQEEEDYYLIIISDNGIIVGFFNSGFGE